MALMGYGPEAFKLISSCNWFYHISENDYEVGDTVALSDWRIEWRKPTEEVMENGLPEEKVDGRPKKVGVSRKACTYGCLPPYTAFFEERRTYLTEKYDPVNGRKAYRVKIIEGWSPCMHLADATKFDSLKLLGWPEIINEYWDQPDDIRERDSDFYIRYGYSTFQEVLIGPQESGDSSVVVLNVLEGTSRRMTKNPLLCLCEHAEKMHENALNLWGGTLGMEEPSKERVEYLMRLKSNERLFNQIKDLTETLREMVDTHQGIAYGEEFDVSLDKIKKTLQEIHRKYMAYEKDDQAGYVETAKKDLVMFMTETETSVN
jgi:hypothetical protein